MSNLANNKTFKIIQKHYAKAILLALLMQVFAFIFIGLRSFNFITPIIIYASLWLLTKGLITRFVNGSTKKTNYITIISSVFIIISFLELFLRLFGIVAVYSEKRDYLYKSMYDDSFADFFINGRKNSTNLHSGTEYLFARVPNKEGYSDKEWNISKPDSCFRILALGDSFTEGDGAHKDSTWVKFLERKYQNNKLEFMNAGLCGTDIVFVFHNFQNKIIKYKPDLVILCINRSDIDDIIIRGGFERFANNKINFRDAPWWEPIYAASHISRLFFRTFFDYYFIAKTESYARKVESMQIIKSSLIKFKEFCSNNNCEFVCVTHPMNNEVRDHNYDYEEIIPFCTKNNIIYIDLYDYYLRQNVDKNINYYYWAKDGHHNANGYKLMAEGIFEGLQRDSLLH